MESHFPTEYLYEVRGIFLDNELLLKDSDTVAKGDFAKTNIHALIRLDFAKTNIYLMIRLL